MQTQDQEQYQDIDDVAGNYTQDYDDQQELDDVTEGDGSVVHAKVALTYQAIKACLITGNDLDAQLDSNIIMPLVNRYGEDVNLSTNWTDLDNGDGAWQLAIQPLKEKGYNEATGKGSIVAIGVGIYKIPTLDGVLALGDNGRLYLNELLRKDALDRLTKARKDGKSLPISLTQFTTFGIQESNELASWNKLKKGVIAYLKTKHLDMSEVELENVLRSSAYADAQYPSIEQVRWETLLNTMIAKCDRYTTVNKLTKKEELTPLNPQVFVNWLQTRSQTTIKVQTCDVGALDFSDLI